ncbi:ribonuclease H family protein [Phyllobacterium myrsinacearum]|uniref:ribonuclease H n=1 Tax=Phyllobacterium myrsinacearum TaxID=28101 RepID=A0A839EPA0_9HYPH|nr:ribonuclease H [Phyllobacterium myrsinacearum]MBA8878297.1 ribonuclease HI [Phyllobacterium myrsinacearum]
MNDVSGNSSLKENDTSRALTDQRLEIFVDGCFEPASRRGGWAFVAYRDGVEVGFDFGGEPDSSNNAMEAIAVLKAIVWIQANALKEQAIIWSDSIYAVTGCNNWLPVWKENGWKKIQANPNARRRTISNADVWKAIDLHLHRDNLINIVWCKGHSGIPGNERADELADRGRL